MDPLSLGKSLRSCSVAFHSVREYHLADFIIERTIRQWPDKSNLEDVLTKVVLVNSLYHTNVLDVWKIAQHICSKNIDSKIENGDLTIEKVKAASRAYSENPLRAAEVKRLPERGRSYDAALRRRG